MLLHSKHGEISNMKMNYPSSHKYLWLIPVSYSEKKIKINVSDVSVRGMFWGIHPFLHQSFGNPSTKLLCYAHPTGRTHG